MIFRSTNIYYNQHHDISHQMHLHDEVLRVSYDGNNDDDNNDDTYDHGYNRSSSYLPTISLVVLLHYQLRGQSSSSASDPLRYHSQQSHQRSHNFLCYEISAWSCHVIHHLSCVMSSTIDTYTYISCLLSSFIVLQWGDSLLQVKLQVRLRLRVG